MSVYYFFMVKLILLLIYNGLLNCLVKLVDGVFGINLTLFLGIYEVEVTVDTGNFQVILAFTLVLEVWFDNGTMKCIFDCDFDICE
jgi:hypothetical protein